MGIDPEYLRRETWNLREAACLLAGEDPTGAAAMFYNEPGRGGRVAHIYANLKDATDTGILEFFESRTNAIVGRRVRPWDAIQWAKARGEPIPEFLNGVPQPKPEPKPAEKPLTTTEPHVSPKLATLIQAARKFWSNASRDDRTTHPNNDEVAKWLVDRGFSNGLAEKGATIIRPEWAGSGRKPDSY